MKTIFKHCCWLRYSLFKGTFFLLFLLLSGYLFAQNNNSPVGPFTYSPPTGDLHYTDSYFIEKCSMAYFLMEEVPPFINNEDCLMVEFDLDLDMDNEEGKPILILQDPDFGDFDIELIYSQGTVTVKRHNTSLTNNPYNNTPFYSYHLFDRLFEKDETEFFGEGQRVSTWQIRVYFTSDFMCIVTTRYEDNGYLTGSNRVLSNVHYMSPVFFGLDFDKKYPDPESKMYKYLSNIFALIIMGDFEANFEPYISNAKLYSMKYSSSPKDENDWWWRVQKQFSAPTFNISPEN